MRSTRRHLRTAPLAATAALALALTACNQGQDPKPDETTTAPDVKLTVPAKFDNASPGWKTISDLQGDTPTALSPDGKHYAYAYATGEGGTVEVGQVDLTTGKSTPGQSVEALTPERGEDAHIELMYSGHRLVLLQQGTGEGSKQWNASIFRVGSDSKPNVVTHKLTDQDAEVALPDSRTGPLVSVASSGSTTYYGLDADKARENEAATKASKSFTGCGGDSCDLPLKPVAQVGSSTVSTFQESKAGGRTVCSDSLTDTSPDENGFDGCLRGFGTKDWTSQDPQVAPKGSLPKSAQLYAVGSEHLVGAWQAKGGEGTIYRTINVQDPRRSHVEVTCDNDTAGTATHPMVMSPSGKHAVAGSILFDAQSGEGRCFEDSQGSSDLRFVSVDDSGTAWGSTGSSGDPEAYTSEAVTAKVTDDVVTPVEGEVALPMSFVQIQGRQAATFANSGGQKDGSTVLAAYMRQ